MSEITKPRGLSVECYFCKKYLPAERHTSYDYHNNCDSIYHYPYSELKEVEWDYLGHHFACKNCLDNKDEIILNDMLNSYSNHLDRLPAFKENVRQKYEVEIEKLNNKEQKLLLIVEELRKHKEINLGISKEVQEMISDEYRWKDELKKLFSSPNQSMDSANL